MELREVSLSARDGQILGRYKSDVEPMSAELTSAIDAALARKTP